MRLFYFFTILLIGFPWKGSGQEYFQQEANYHIQVILDDQNHSLKGFLHLEYTNNSPDELEYIYFHLWPNAYKNISTPFAKEQLQMGFTDFYYSGLEEKGHIDSLSFSVNNKPVEFFIDPNAIDIGKLILNQKLLPGETLQIKTPFYVKIPSYFSRLYHFDNDYYITQWYPKPAVYDNSGWHTMSYLDMGEFYSEFGDFHVDIYAPSEYLIAATGNDSTSPYANAKTASFVLPDHLKNYEKWTYQEKKIHDFAWFASKNFTLQERLVTIPETGNKVKLEAYHIGSITKKYEKAIDYLEEGVLFYSRYCMPYPYETCKIVLGRFDGGMEYPTISLIGPVLNPNDLESLIVHEVGHNWFYGILGFNERDYPWLDEGWNTFYESFYMQNKYQSQEKTRYLSDFGSRLIGMDAYSSEEIYKLLYTNLAKKRKDMAMNLSSEEYDFENYGGIVYMKAGLSVGLLRNYLGAALFDSIMQSFFDQWQFKHPDEQDLEKHFREATIKDLDWFFEDVLKSTKSADYKIQKSNNEKVYVKNIRSLNIPLSVSFHYGNQIYDTLIWPTAKKFDIPVHRPGFDKIILDPNKNPLDLNIKNNNYKNRKVFPKADPWKVKLFGIFEKPGYHQVNVAPLMGWNKYDQFMPGILVYQSPVPFHNFEYSLLPMFGSATKEMNGMYALQYHWRPLSTFKALDFQTSYSRFSLIQDLAPYDKFRFTSHFFLDKTSTMDSYFTLDYHYLNIPLEYVSGTDQKKHLYKLMYTLKKDRTINIHKSSFSIEGGKGFVKSYAETTFKWKFPNRSGIDMRAFAGAFLYESNAYYGNYNFRLSGWHGLQDYTYSSVFLGRSEIPGKDSLGILERQFVRADGGFTTFTFLGQTNDWILSTNFNYKPPVILPVEPYINIALVSPHSLPANTSSLFWESGIEISLIPDIFEVYFPVFMSYNLKKQSDSISEIYWDKVRFTLRLEMLNPFPIFKSYF